MNPPQQSKAARSFASRTSNFTHRMSAPDSAPISDTTAQAVVVHCHCPTWWLIGWHRAAIRRLLDDALQETDAQTVKALMRHKEAALRLDETNKNPTP